MPVVWQTVSWKEKALHDREKQQRQSGRFLGVYLPRQLGETTTLDVPVLFRWFMTSTAVVAALYK